MPGALEQEVPQAPQLFITKRSCCRPLKPVGPEASAIAEAAIASLADGDAYLPTADQCEAHLWLLEAFVCLNCEVGRLAEKQCLSGDFLWRHYVKQAAANFAGWVSSLCEISGAVEHLDALPTLDVIMIWHAFMLNPVKYAEFEALAQIPKEGLDWVLLSRDFGPSFSLMDLQFPAAVGLEIADTVATAPDFQFTGKTGPVKFEFDLEAALHRQFSFATKMVQYAWHRGPDIDGTLSRATGRYHKFFALLNANRSAKTKVVPTVDIDLVWHTHQLSPARYRAFSRLRADGRFVGHDDNMSSQLLLDSFAATEALHRRLFGEEYHLCLCWLCELARSRPESVVSTTASGAHAGALRAVVDAALDKERNRRERLGLDVRADLAAPGCDRCGTHGGTDCSRRGLSDDDDNCCTMQCSSCGCGGNCGKGNCSCTSYGGGGGNCGGCSGD